MHERQVAIERQIIRAMLGGVAISVHVQPRASRTEAAGIHGDALKIRVAASPVDGAANDELWRFIARHCDASLNAIEILSGAGARQKRLLVKGGLSSRCESDFNSKPTAVNEEVIFE